MTRRVAALLLVLVSVAGAAEDWARLGREWHLALARYDRALGRLRSDRARRSIAHPFRKFAKRLRAYVQDHANSPAAAPGFVELLRFTRDKNEQHRIMVHLRENHLRSPYLVGAIESLTRIADDEARRTLRDIATAHPDATVREGARQGLYEIGYLTVGRHAPEISGPAQAGGNYSLIGRRGKVIVLVFCSRDQETWREELSIAQRWKGPPTEILAVQLIWKEHEAIARRWNALERPRSYVIDAKGVIRAKDIWGDALVAEIARLVK